MTPSEKILQKTLVTSGLDSAQWNQVQAGMRDRAFFSSRVESAKFLHSAKAQIADLSAGNRSASEIRRDLRGILDATGYTAGDGEAGTIKDLRSQARLDVLIQTNARQARGYMQQLEGNTAGALAAFPGQELLRTRRSKVARDWATRWQGAGGRMHGGRMVALKNDPVWVKLSRFGVPWPPFDFGSGMGVQDLDRAESISLGLIKEEDPTPQPAEIPGFNAELESSVPFGGEDMEWMWLKGAFGDQITHADGKVKWQAELLKDAVSGKSTAAFDLGKVQSALTAKAPADLKAGLADGNLSLSPEWLRTVAGSDTATDDLPLLPGDMDLLPAMWRNPDRVTKGPDGKTAVLELDTFDGGTMELVVDLSTGIAAKTLRKKAII